MKQSSKWRSLCSKSRLLVNRGEKEVPAPAASNHEQETPMECGCHFLTYANDNVLYAQHAENYCHSALENGFTSARFYREAELQEKPFWQENAGILSLPRGAGYWLWKPYIILEQLRNLPVGDVLVYSDAGRGLAAQVTYFETFPENTLQMAHLSRRGFIVGLTTNWAAQGAFTKPRCFRLMEADTPEMHAAPQVQATWSVWKHCSSAIAFLEEWLACCRDPRILLDDGPEHLADAPDDFRDHRHDQAVCSILAHRRKAHFFKLHEKSVKEKFNTVRAKTAQRPDAYKRLTTMENLLKLMMADEPGQNACERRLGVLAKIVAHAIEDEETPSIAKGRANKTPLQRIHDYVAKVRVGATGSVVWEDIWPAIRSDTKRGYKTLIKGKKRPEIEALRAEILDEHKTWLRTNIERHGEAFQANYSAKAAKAHFSEHFGRRFEAANVVLPETLWSKLASTLDGQTKKQIRSLMGRLPIAEEARLREEWALGFHDVISVDGRTAPADLGVPYLKSCLEAVFDALPTDHPAQKWRRIEGFFSADQERLWGELCSGRQLHIVILYQDVMIAALENVTEDQWHGVINRIVAELGAGELPAELMRRYG